MFRFRLLISVLVLSFTALFCSAADRILFVRIAPTQASLFISNADGSGEQPLTQAGAFDYNPAWSAKGDWIAFTSERSGSADLYRIHPDGSGLDRLTADPAFDDQAAFSPDGKQIVFVSTRAAGTANLWTLNLDTRKATPLTAGKGGDFRPAWSPDGKWIAFSSDRESDLPPAKGRWERLHLVDVYLIRPDGSGVKRLSEHRDFCGSPKWTRDSKSVVSYCMSGEESFTYRVGTSTGEDGDTSLVQFDIATGQKTAVAAGPGIKEFPTVLPSGEIAYVRRENPGLGVFFSSGKLGGVFYTSGKTGPAGSNVRSPSWSPDGTHVVYSRYIEKRVPEAVKVWSRIPNYELYTTSLLPAYDPTGKRFVVTTLGRMSSLAIVDEGKPARSIFERKELVLGPEWSPDGRQIIFGIGAFTSFIDLSAGGKTPIDAVNGGAQVGMINADGSDFHLVTSGSNNNAFASFAPDGKRIVYRTAGPDGEGLRIMNLADHSVTVLTNSYDNFPMWSPRGDLIAFIRKIGPNFDVFTIRPDGTEVHQLTDVLGNEAHLAWSPDGQRIAFASTRMGFKDEALYGSAPQPSGEIFVMRYDGTHVEQLTDNQWEDGGPAWQPNPSDH